MLHCKVNFRSYHQLQKYLLIPQICYCPLKQLLDELCHIATIGYMTLCIIYCMYMCTCTDAEYVELAALVVLPSLLPDSRVKVDVTKVIQLAKVQY